MNQKRAESLVRQYGGPSPKDVTAIANLMIQNGWGVWHAQATFYGNPCHCANCKR